MDMNPFKFEYIDQSLSEEPDGEGAYEEVAIFKDGLDNLVQITRTDLEAAIEAGEFPDAFFEHVGEENRDQTQIEVIDYETLKTALDSLNDPDDWGVNLDDYTKLSFREITIRDTEDIPEVVAAFTNPDGKMSLTMSFEEVSEALDGQTPEGVDPEKLEQLSDDALATAQAELNSFASKLPTSSL